MPDTGSRIHLVESLNQNNPDAHFTRTQLNKAKCSIFIYSSEEAAITLSD